jgi:aminoglycoside phosphotransferase
MILPEPIETQPHYGDHLGDAQYWGQYVLEVLHRERLPVTAIEEPFVGSFPTFLVGDLVIKLFGRGFDGGDSWASERSMHEVLATWPDLPAPPLVAHGHLFDDPDRWRWPYLVTKRVRGEAVRDRALRGQTGRDIAERLGELVATLHNIEPPDEVVDRALIARLRSDAPARLSTYGLPAHLVEQVPTFLADAPDPTTLVHADITADHLFHDGRSITGIIDWGDAIVADRWYELVPIAFDCFGSDLELLAAFLDGYGWAVDATFARRVMQAVCEFQFNAISTISQLVDLQSVTSIDELADRLFGSLRLP